MQSSELAEFLNSEDNLYGLDYIATHGFLCATIVGPALAEWQHVLFDNHTSSLPGGVLDAIHAWRGMLENELKTNERIQLPIDATVQNELENELGDWSVGFVDAVYANEEVDWFDAGSDVAELTLPMVVFSGIEEDDDALIEIRKNDALLEQMANSVERNISELYLLFHTTPIPPKTGKV